MAASCSPLNTITRWIWTDVDDTAIKQALVEHYSYAAKLTAEGIRSLLEQRESVAYLHPAPAVKVYRGLFNLTFEQVQALQAATASTAGQDLSWTTSEEVAWRFARAEWTLIDREPGMYAVVLVAKPDPDKMILDATQTSVLAGVGDWFHDRWQEPLAAVIRMEAEVLTADSLTLIEVLVEANPIDLAVVKTAKRIARSLHPQVATPPEPVTTMTTPPPSPSTTQVSKAESNWTASGDRKLKIVEGDWDGDAAAASVFEWAGWTDDAETSKPDPAKAKRAFLIYDAGNPDLKGSYKLPFARVEDGSLVAVTGGLSAARGRVKQVQDAPADVVESAQATLNAYAEREEEELAKRRSAPQGQPNRTEREEATKSLLDGELVAGIHIHNWDEEASQTAVDGAHRHDFVLPDGTKVQTELGGQHQHRGYEGSTYLWGGPHVHLVLLEDGSEAWTEIGGDHSHSILGTSTGIDGQHDHVLVLADGSTITSLGVGHEATHTTPAPAAEDLLKTAMLKSVPNVQGRTPATWSTREDGGIEVRIRYRKEAIAWRFTGKAGLTKATAELLSYEDARWIPTANDTTDPFGVKHTNVVKGYVEQGTRTGTELELFCEGGTAGRLLITQSGSKLLATLDPSAAPLAYQRGELGPVPSSLAKQIPSCLRWWDTTNLAESCARLIKARELGVFDLVDASTGTWRRLEKVVAYQPVMIGEGPELLEILKKAIPTGTQLVPVFSRARVDKAITDTSFVLVDSGAEGWDLRRAVGTCKSVGKPAMAVAKDGLEARTALESLGFLYAVRCDKAAAIVVGCTQAINDPHFVRVTAKALAPVHQATGITMDRSRAMAALQKALRVNKVLTGVRGVKLAKADDAPVAKRLVYGIVLEPNSTDAHGDTLDPETIEQAAHGYLAYNGNSGFQHSFLINEHAQVVESYVAPSDMTIGGTSITKGTWIMVMKILDESLWNDIQSGAIGGFSIGGLGVRTPV